MNILYYSIIQDEKPEPLFVGSYEECKTEVKNWMLKYPGIRYNITKTEIINTYMGARMSQTLSNIPAGSTILFPTRPSLPC